MNITQYLKIHHPLSSRQGKFTTCYLYDDHVILHSCDSIKECMSLGWFPVHRLIPVISHNDFITTSRDDYSVYTMERFSQPTSLKASLDFDDWLLYKALRVLMSSLVWPKSDYDRLDYFRLMVNSSSLDNEIKELLIDCFEACMNYSDRIGFEISPRNVGVLDGRLILLDCFFIY